MNMHIIWLRIKCKVFKIHHWEDHIQFLSCRFCGENKTVILKE